MNRLSALSALLVLAGCGSLTQQLKTIGPEQADAFEKAATAQWNTSDRGRQARPEPVYAQPLNKTEPCKLPATSDQLARSNLKVYWDGECKNGFAYGLGRDIAISDTHHYEEIAFHHGTGWYQAGDSLAFFDFAGKVAVYRRLVSDAADEFVTVTEVFRPDERGNPYTVVKRRVERNAYYEVSRIPQLALPVTIGYVSANIAYRHTDWSNVPQAPYAGVFEVFEAQSRRQSPWTLVADRAGQLHGFEGQNVQRQKVKLPEAYVRRILDKSREAQAIEQQMDEAYARAKSMEREYLYGVCENNRQSPGIPQETYAKICSFVKGNEEAKSIALATYAAAAEKQAQQAAQQMAQLAARQEGQRAEAALQRNETANALNSALADFNRSMKQMRENAEQMSRSFEATNPSVPSFGLPRNRVMNCMNISGIVTCR